MPPPYCRRCACEGGNDSAGLCVCCCSPGEPAIAKNREREAALLEENPTVVQLRAELHAANQEVRDLRHERDVALERAEKAEFSVLALQRNLDRAREDHDADSQLARDEWEKERAEWASLYHRTVARAQKAEKEKVSAWVRADQAEVNVITLQDEVESLKAEVVATKQAWETDRLVGWTAPPSVRDEAMTAHTPGPWQYVSPNQVWAGDTRSRDTRKHIVSGPQYLYKLPDDWEEQEANVRLCARAPELLAENEELRERVEILTTALAQEREALRKGVAERQQLEAQYVACQEQLIAMRKERDKLKSCWKCKAELVLGDDPPHCEDCPRYDVHEDEEAP